jgi:hypothetical protein
MNMTDEQMQMSGNSSDQNMMAMGENTGGQ